jgi:hypothetical protein
MTEQAEKVSFHFIKPLERLPNRTRDRHSIYGGIIDEFVESGLKYALVNEMNRKPMSVYIGLRTALRRRGIRDIMVCQIQNQIYLKKLG